jgi:hypothetical protein
MKSLILWRIEAVPKFKIRNFYHPVLGASGSLIEQKPVRLNFRTGLSAIIDFDRQDLSKSIPLQSLARSPGKPFSPL